MHVKPPSVSMSKPPATLMFRLPGKRISVEIQGRATIVTLTFDDLDASGSAELNATSVIASPNGGMIPK